MIVPDANILIRAVLGRRVRQLIDTYAGQGVRFFAPDVAFDDAEKYLPSLLKKTMQAPRRLFGIARILAKHHRDSYSRTLRHL
jgi:predicted nucleic acid-binding protein